MAKSKDRMISNNNQPETREFVTGAFQGPSTRTQLQERNMKPTRTKRQWQRVAKICARISFTEDIASRWGTIVDEEHGALAFVNNWPYAHYPDLRDRQLAKFREFLQAHGIEELAYATYPENGYTYALIVKAEVDQHTWLVEEMRRI